MKQLLFLLVCPILAAQGRVDLSASGVIVDPTTKSTIVQIRATSEGGNLAAFENKAGTIKVFRDNLGANLMVGTYHWKWVQNVEVARNGRMATLDLVAAQMPARGATRLTVEGALNFVMASQRVIAREEASLREGATGPVGEQFYEVTHIAPVLGTSNMTVHILYPDLDKDQSPVNAIKYFYDGEELAGKKVRFIKERRGRKEFLTLPRDVEKFEIEIDYWEGWEPVKVPYKFTLEL
ncbi:MAG: hypothetical protein QNK37_04465 [Acidobacteriota bacterium]|nr:hypothetical protein [Acidobacteriota bacterium]